MYLCTIIMVRYNYHSATLCLVVCLSLTPCAFARWKYGEDKIRGVNLGGWLILEKWMTPKVFKGLPENVDDEYKFVKHLGHAEAEKRLKVHWNSWVSEADILEMKNAGINHVRLPIGYWALDVKDGEPWVKGSWDYVVKAVGWCKKHGIQVLMDFHAAPGSQNGNDHSGQSGNISFYYNDDNLDRATNVVKLIAKWANGTEWRETVSMIQILNEPVLWGNDYHFRLKKLKKYYRMAYDAVRSVNDIAVFVVHDAFIDLENWEYFRDDKHYWWVMLDTHLYQVFGEEYQNLSCQQHEAVACKYRDRLGKSSQKLWTMVGEFSLSTPKPCSNQKDIARQQLAIYEQYASGWFFWSHNNAQGWKEWSFKDSLKNKWIRPKDKNEAKC